MAELHLALPNSDQLLLSVYMNQIKKLGGGVGIAFVCMLAFIGCASDRAHHDHSGHTHAADSTGAKAYPLKTCLVTDEDLDTEPFAFVHKGQQIKLCCEGCREDFDKEPAKYLKKLAGK